MKLSPGDTYIKELSSFYTERKENALNAWRRFVGHSFDADFLALMALTRERIVTTVVMDSLEMF